MPAETELKVPGTLSAPTSRRSVDLGRAAALGQLPLTARELPRRLGQVRFTARQQDALVAIATSGTAVGAAREIGISVDALTSHLHAVTGRLALPQDVSRAHLTAWAAVLGFLDHDWRTYLGPRSSAFDGEHALVMAQLVSDRPTEAAATRLGIPQSRFELLRAECLEAGGFAHLATAAPVWVLDGLVPLRAVHLSLPDRLFRQPPAARSSSTHAVKPA
jgi:hypothetical protein